MDTDLTNHHQAVKELLDWAEANITDLSEPEFQREDLEARFLAKVQNYGPLDLDDCCKRCDPVRLLARSLANYLDKQHVDCWNLHFLAYYVAVHKEAHTTEQEKTK